MTGADSGATMRDAGVTERDHHAAGSFPTVREATAPAASADERPRLSPAGIERFRDARVLGQFSTSGAEADAYLCERDGASLFLKLYRPGIAPKPHLADRLRQLSAARPRHVVPLLECGADPASGRWYELQEYLRGGTLRELLGNPVGADQFGEILAQCAAGLEAIHAAGILHLDLKPANVLVRSLVPLDLALADFGVSSTLDAEIEKKWTAVRGTPQYWAPESVSGIVSPAVDWWSLGMILLESALGRHPYDGIDTKVILLRLATDEVGLPPDLSPERQELLGGLLTRDPSARWGAGEVRRWLAGERGIPVKRSTAGAPPRTCRHPFQFRGKGWTDLPALLDEYARSPDAFAEGVRHFAQGYLTGWLERNEDFERASGLRAIAEQVEARDDEERLQTLIYRYGTPGPFRVHGAAVDPDILADAIAARPKSSGRLPEPLRQLLNGRLLEYYSMWRAVARSGDDLLEAMLRTGAGCADLHAAEAFRFVTLCRDFLDALDRHVLPADVDPARPRSVAEYVLAHPDGLLRRDELETIRLLHVTPFDLSRPLGKHVAGMLARLHRSGRLLEISRLERLTRDCMLPTDFIDLLRKSDLERYLLLSEWIAAGPLPRAEFAALCATHALPDEILAGYRGGSAEEYIRSCDFIRTSLERFGLCRIDRMRDWTGHLDADPLSLAGLVRRADDGYNRAAFFLSDGYEAFVAGNRKPFLDLIASADASGAAHRVAHTETIVRGMLLRIDLRQLHEALDGVTRRTRAVFRENAIHLALSCAFALALLGVAVSVGTVSAYAVFATASAILAVQTCRTWSTDGGIVERIRLFDRFAAVLTMRERALFGTTTAPDG